MILQSLLEDERTKWQINTQEEILANLLCKSHKYKYLGKKEERLVMVFGKSHAGKTTFILTILGVDEKKIDEVNLILRAGVPEGCSSTSTAIIYQKSDDDMFGICERGINDVSSYDIIKCTKEEFINSISEIRIDVESGKRKNCDIIYLYLPKEYFCENEWYHGDISILDVPGYETRNEKEKYHTDALLNKYMSISVLNIIVRSINDINDLQYFVAPNRDDVNKLTSGKYIIVTTRSYSAENVFKYFTLEKSERKISFEDMLEKEIRQQFERVFVNKVPVFFPVDIGQSFHMLIDKKIANQEDREYLIGYRNNVFKKIYECIYSKQSNSLISWIQEVIEDEDYYGNIEKEVINRDKRKSNKELQYTMGELEKINRQIEGLQSRLNEVDSKTSQLKEQQKSLCLPNFINIIDERIDEYRNMYFDDHYKWNTAETEKTFSLHIIDIYTEIMTDFRDSLIGDEDFMDEIEKNNSSKIVEDNQQTLWEEIEDMTNKHKVLKILNPSNKEKLDIGKELLKKYIPETGKYIFDLVYRTYTREIDYIELNEKKKLETLIKDITNKKKQIEINIRKKEEQIDSLDGKMRFVEQQIEKDKDILSEYRKIARKHFQEQRGGIIERLNKISSSEDKLNYIMFLAIISNDYKKIIME